MGSQDGDGSELGTEAAQALQGPGGRSDADQSEIAVADTNDTCLVRVSDLVAGVLGGVVGGALAGLACGPGRCPGGQLRSPTCPRRQLLVEVRSLDLHWRLK